MSGIMKNVWEYGLKPDPWDLLTHTPDAAAPVLYKYSKEGLISPVDGRKVIDQVNNKVLAELSEQEKALDKALKKAIPGWQTPNGEFGTLAKTAPNAIDFTKYPDVIVNETTRISRMGGKAAEAAAKAEAEKQEKGNRLLSQSIISAGNYTMLSLQRQLEQQVDTSYRRKAILPSRRLNKPSTRLGNQIHETNGCCIKALSSSRKAGERQCMQHRQAQSLQK